MARYIDAERMKIEIRIAMAEQLHKYPFNTIPTQLAELLCAFADDTPTAEVEEVRHGEWVEWYPPKEYIITSEEMLYCCSMCDAKYEDVEGYKYCPYCGAKMDGGKRE